MKESIGGTWLFGIVIAFVVFFTTYISVSTNYSRCFRIKDEILSTVERYKGINEKSLEYVSKYLSSIGYSSTGACPEQNGCWYGFRINDTAPTTITDANFCVRRFTVVDKPSTNADSEIVIDGPIGHPPSAYYQIVVFFKLSWPIVDTFININIDGETSIIYNFNDISQMNSNNCVG